MLSQVLEYFLFYSSLKKQINLDWVHLSADRKTYLVSLSALLVFKANGIFEVYFYIKMLSKFHVFFPNLTYMTTSVLRYCAFSSLKTAMKLFAAVLQIKEAKVIVVEDTDHKCTCNNFTRKSENLDNFFCKSYIWILNWGQLLLDFLLCQVWNALNCLLNISGQKGVGIRGSFLSCKFCVELHYHDDISSVKARPLLK